MFKKKYRALSWKGTSHAPKHASSQKTGKALWQKRIWVSWWTLSWAWAIKAPFQQGRPAASWAALGRASAAGWGRWFSPSSQHWWATWGVHGLVQGSPRWTDMDELERVQQRATKTNGMEHLMYKPSQKATSAQPGEERHQERSYLHFKRRCKEGRKQAPFSGPQRMGSNGHKMKHKFHLNIWKTSLLWGLWNTGTNCPEGLRGFQPWRYSKCDWIRSWAISSRWPCFQQSSLTGWSQRCLPTSTVLWELLWQHALILGQCRVPVRISL